MKKFSVMAFAMFMLVLVFFTLFGNAVYDRVTPEVSFYTAGSSIKMDGATYMRVPRGVLSEDGTVFELVSGQAFGREVYTLRALEIAYAENLFDWEDDVIYVYQGLRSGTRLLLNPDGSAGEGDRVRPARRRG